MTFGDLIAAALLILFLLFVGVFGWHEIQMVPKHKACVAAGHVWVRGADACVVRATP